ncbi:MAG: RidA family protein [Chloroflexaceae bacterium]|nr:RidA family protein [Chloroflexaceae bacterium]
MDRHVIQTDNAPAAIGPYSQAIASGPLIFVSGQIPLDPTTGTLITGDIASQTRQVLHNAQAILQAAGSSLEQVVKTTVFLADINDFAAMNTVYAEFFGDTVPARSAMQVAALPKGARIEIEMIALRPDS